MFFLHFNALFHLFRFPQIVQQQMLGELGAWINLMTSTAGNKYTKNYKNLIIFSYDTTENAMNVFDAFCLFWCLFHEFWFPRVVQKHMLGEVGIWVIVWLPVVSTIFLPKIIKIW